MWMNVDLNTPRERDAFMAFCKGNGIYAEPSKDIVGYHIEVKITKGNEITMCNEFLANL